jgi:hypothetical protein
VEAATHHEAALGNATSDGLKPAHDRPVPSARVTPQDIVRHIPVCGTTAAAAGQGRWSCSPASRAPAAGQRMAQGARRDVSSTMRATMALTMVLGMNQNISPVRRVTRMPLVVSSDLSCSAKSGGNARQIVPYSPTMSSRRGPGRP